MLLFLLIAVKNGYYKKYPLAKVDPEAGILLFLLL